MIVEAAAATTGHDNPSSFALGKREATNFAMAL